MKLIRPVLLAVIAVSTLAFIALGDVINELGMKHSTAQHYILGNLVGSFDASPIGSSPAEDAGGDVASGSLGAQLKSFKIPRSRSLKNIVTGDRAAIAKEVCRYVKEYLNSKEFMEVYTALREKTKPLSEPPRLPASEIQSIEKNLVQAEKALTQAAGYMTQQQLADAKKAIAEQKLRIQEQKDPAPNKTQWEKMYPADPALVIKRRLQEYLALAATVDYKAELTGSGSNRTFVNPAYEAKPVKWKTIYRAGKEVNQVVTNFVKQWLAGDIISKEKTTMSHYNDVETSKSVNSGKPEDGAKMPVMAGSGKSGSGKSINPNAGALKARLEV